MLGKVLKYDLKSMGKSLFPLYAALLIMALIIRGTDLLSNVVSFVSVLNKFMIVFFIVLLVAAFFYTFFVAIKRYYKNLYSDEGYLTHTLPVTTGSLLTSKIISSFVYLIGSSILVGGSIFIAFGNADMFKTIGEIFEMAATLLNLNTATLVTFVICSLVLGYLSYIMIFFTGIALGQSHSSNKMIFSVVYTVAIYYFGQLISLIFLAIMAFSNPEFIAMLDNQVPSVDVVKQIFMFAIIANTLLCALYYGISYNRLKHLNLQ